MSVRGVSTRMTAMVAPMLLASSSARSTSCRPTPCDCMSGCTANIPISASQSD
eukprot:CAMPEP_0202827606 /NCGR_PEP_ID=MMETSP1389-20130828/14390_1 /ASSEMBLY_ACC=CAM_ASM_000865 /TAXON_ID=302021 /ORGANISM="Rhodomonas sp., Strain CCMP768" /LENGTH=52 /DNA_ID=CAMNT_0049501027 /DNA_START=86 /DNA_END=241 /DNA_ORIENTATION=+